MRWRILICLILVILITPVVLADISLEGFSSVDYNLGDNIIIGGRILYGERIDGRLNIDLVCSEDTIPVYFYLVNLRANVPYDFLEGVPARETMLGDCYFWLKLSDDNGRLLLERTSEKIYVSDNLKISARLDDLYKNPGEIVEISGDVKKANGLKLGDGSLDLILDDTKIYTSRVVDGLFDYKLTLDDNIKSGKHELSLAVDDKNGNDGRIDLGFEVNAIPKKLDIEMSSETLKPNDILSLKVLISDQAGDLLSKGISVDFFNPFNEIISSVSEISGDTIQFKLPEFASPGIWKVKAVSGDLFRWEDFSVQEVVDKEIKLEGDILYIRNIGNVDYNNDVEIILERDKKDYTIVRKTSLKPNQTISIDLTKEIPAGEYKYNIAGSAITGNVVLEKGVMEINGNKLTGYLALVFVLVFLMFLVFTRGKKVANAQRDRERAEGRKRLEELKRTSKSRTFEKGSTKEDIEFLIKKVQEREDKKDRSSGLLPSFD